MAECQRMTEEGFLKEEEWHKHGGSRVKADSGLREALGIARKREAARALAVANAPSPAALLARALEWCRANVGELTVALPRTAPGGGDDQSALRGIDDLSNLLLVPKGWLCTLTHKRCQHTCA